MPQATAPYNFVPPSETVVFPSWAHQVSHDVPFRDGLCGWLELEITAHTPLFIRGADGDGAFFRTPDGEALPGTSLKGMLRNVLQIASFGKLGPVNDRKISFRDPGNPKYRKALGRVRAGWLTVNQASIYDEPEAQGTHRWQIQPVAFAQIDYSHYASLFPGFDPGKERAAHERYDALPSGSTLSCKCSVAPPIPPRRLNRVTAVGPTEPTAGTIVLTGQHEENSPPRAGKKHHDFFFYGSAGKLLPVPFSVRRDFSQIHSNGGEQHQLDGDPNPEWQFWLDKWKSNPKEPIPVFFALDGGKVAAMGLAMMFRFPCATSTEGAVRNAQKEFDDGRFDVAELIFGRVRPNGAATEALRGRASLEAARLSSGPPRFVGQKVEGVLGAPRASYYPNYLRQPQDGEYSTYMDRNAKARGWKRYPTRSEEVDLPEVPTNDRGEEIESQKTEFLPLEKGAKFSTRLNFHNLRRVELGALLWAIDFGGRTECRHGLGLAKPYGYGAVSMKINSSRIVPNDRTFPPTAPAGEKPAEAPEFLKALRDEFRAYMEKKVAGGWECSDQIYQLVTMARPPANDAQRAKLKPMKLDPQETPTIDQFKDAKDNPEFALPKYGEAAEWETFKSSIVPPPEPAFLPPLDSPPRIAAGRATLGSARDAGRSSRPSAATPRRVVAAPAPALSEFDQRIAFIRSLKANFAGQSQRHLDWFATLTDPRERRYAAQVMIQLVSEKTARRKAKDGSTDWQALLEAAKEESS